ncbi:helix-turn-helix transcriptional regulator [Frankia sp. Cas4]|uniref:helix-turn-helix domain-containing protein n=1 Tax=Frankia sp. Cas4 TaxID=3073927 RepID=UPI002AD28C79|nr:helix-turn-helix transcriptional regulator [Frankia sp. Cas4]
MTRLPPVCDISPWRALRRPRPTEAALVDRMAALWLVIFALGLRKACEWADPGLAVGHRLAEMRQVRGLTRQQVAERMGVTKGRISQIEQGSLSGQEVVARYAAALGGRLHQAIYFDDGDIAAIA